MPQRSEAALWLARVSIDAIAAEAAAATESTTRARTAARRLSTRARRNIETLIERLTGQGYRFHANDDDQDTVVPPAGSDPGCSRTAELAGRAVRPAPLTLPAWIRIAGNVWLVGTHPQWPESAEADPLVVKIEGARFPGSPIRDYYDEALAAWRT